MTVSSVEEFDVEIAAQVRGESPAEFFDESEGEVLGVGRSSRSVEFQLRAIAEVDDGSAQGFVHGDVGVAVASDARLVAQGLAEAFADDDAGIFHGVVEIDVDITIDLDFQINQRVSGEKSEHVVEEGDSGVDPGVSLSVQVQAEFDLGLSGISFLGCSAFAHSG